MQPVQQCNECQKAQLSHSSTPGRFYLSIAEVTDTCTVVIQTADLIWPRSIRCSPHPHLTYIQLPRDNKPSSNNMANTVNFFPCQTFSCAFVPEWRSYVTAHPVFISRRTWMRYASPRYCVCVCTCKCIYVTAPPVSSSCSVGWEYCFLSASGAWKAPLLTSWPLSAPSCTKHSADGLIQTAAQLRCQAWKIYHPLCKNQPFKLYI